MSKTLNILGVTGSIGSSAVDVVLSAPGKFRVNAISAHDNVDGLIKAAVALNARMAIITNPSHYSALKDGLAGTNILAGCDLDQALTEKADITLAAIVGMAALRPVLAAVRHGGVLALASKEPIVAAGTLLLETAKSSGTQILPVDSEHNAVFQVSHREAPPTIERIILTASGGPFRNWTTAQMGRATRAQALAHPNWSMGPKISVDSATMMNKALEIIEAHFLFAMRPEKIDVLIHPQSIVHSMVEYRDGSVLAQMGASDMRTPIAHALAWPERMQTPGARLDFKTLKSLDFEEPDFVRFPALKLAYECLEAGQAHCIALNAANEKAVDAFLCGQIGFADIIHVIEYVLSVTQPAQPTLLEQIEELDLRARATAHDFINGSLTHKTIAI